MLRPSWKRGTQSSVNNRDDWQILDSVTLFENPHIEIRQERVIPPGETRERHWTVSRRKKAVVVAPLTNDGKFILIRQARIPVRKFLWEFPAGQVDSSTNPDRSTLEETVHRELEEETGHHGKTANEENHPAHASVTGKSPAPYPNVVPTGDV